MVDAQGQHTAKVPSGTLRIDGEMDIEGNTTSTATLDFIADESLHKTGNGQYILAPVVHVKTRNDARVEINSDNSAEISGGVVKSDFKVGMNAQGDVGAGLSIPADVNVSIGQQGEIVIGKKIGKLIAIGGNVSSGTCVRIY